MPVLGALHVALEVPDLEPGIRFYSDAGLEPVRANPRQVGLRCAGQHRDSLVLIKSTGAKRLHHISLRADGLEALAMLMPKHGGKIVEAPKDFESVPALWVRDPHGMLIQLIDTPADPELKAGALFEINAPGRRVRIRRSATLPQRQCVPVKPYRLGHIVVFTPDVLRSVHFMTTALGLGLADQVQDVIAFCCARTNSDHHVVAFAKSPAIGFHHASFQVADPDQVGRGGRALAEKAGKGNWGFGRHTIGSNFFHYIQDPWGSWFEYYSDMDFIDDYSQWSPTNYGMEDGLANWGPPVPPDFILNHEAENPGAAV